MVSARIGDGTEWWPMSIDFRSLRAVVLDMDGVLWRGQDPLPGVPEFFQFLNQHNVVYTLATNNSTRTTDMFVEKLAQFGVPARPEQVITSSVATAAYIGRHYPVDTPIYVVGEAGIKQALAEAGYREDPDHARLVVVGLDFGVTYDRLRIATLRIREGAHFIGTNGDKSFPAPEGLVPGNGALLAAIQTATDVNPVVIGKPETAMFEVALERMGSTPDTTLMIGDRLETDILGGVRAGLKTVLVLTGTTTADQAREAPIQADMVVETLSELLAAWSADLTR